MHIIIIIIINIIIIVIITSDLCLLTVLTTWETSNRYQVKNSIGQQVYFAAEGLYGCIHLLTSSNVAVLLKVIMFLKI